MSASFTPSILIREVTTTCPGGTSISKHVLICHLDRSEAQWRDLYPHLAFGVRQDVELPLDSPVVVDPYVKQIQGAPSLRNRGPRQAKLAGVGGKGGNHRSVVAGCPEMILDTAKLCRKSFWKTGCPISGALFAPDVGNRRSLHCASLRSR